MCVCVGVCMSLHCSHRMNRKLTHNIVTLDNNYNVKQAIPKSESISCLHFKTDGNVSKFNINYVYQSNVSNVCVSNNENRPSPV